MTPRALAASLAAALALAANAMAATAPSSETSRLMTQYVDWAGGKPNAEALITGLRNGSPITIVTSGPDHSVSIAGFTPSAPMSASAVSSALAGAQRSLARMGISRPTAEQIQAALIGGEVLLPSGATAQMRGAVVARGTGPSQVARR
jgi:hypothetical protein